jgi:FixJ family two-component response regulator
MNQNKIKIAVVDDDASFACALERRFRASGFEVRTYPSAEVFLARPTQPQPDCLVLDIHLGGMSGLDLQRRLRELGALVPIIFVTAHDAPGIREEAERAGCSAYFLKPVPGHLLIEAITKAVEPSSN